MVSIGTREFIFNSYSDQQVAFPTQKSLEKKLGQKCRCQRTCTCGELILEIEQKSINEQTWAEQAKQNSKLQGCEVRSRHPDTLDKRQGQPRLIQSRPTEVTI